MRGQIVLVPFPFTDLQSHKIRPAIVLSNNTFKSGDVILSAISSRSWGVNEVMISNSLLREGRLPVTSYVKTARIATLHISLIRRVVAQVSSNTMKEISEAVTRLIS